MRRQLIAGLVVSSLLGAVPAFAQAQLPAEVRGTDPKPDTNTAADFLRRGRYEDAIRQAKLALGRDERYVPAMVVLAKAYYYQHKHELASAIIDIAQKIDGSNAELYNLLGFISLDKNDRISATAAFKKATELKGDYPAAWNNLAAQYLYAKNYDGALEAAERAAKLAPSWAKAHMNLGSALRGKLEHEKADAEYKKALQLDPSYAEAVFNQGILYLDAKQMPGMDVIQKLNTAIGHFNRYKQLAASRLTKDDPVDTYLAEAKAGIEKEQKRIERQRKQEERNKAKAAPAAAPAGGAK